MAKRPLGPYKARDGTVLTCACCGKQDAFEERHARVWAAPGWRALWRRVTQVGCWNCGHIHWFMR